VRVEKIMIFIIFVRVDTVGNVHDVCLFIYHDGNISFIIFD